MATFYTEDASLSSLEVSGSVVISGSIQPLVLFGSGSDILVVSGSNGGLLNISEKNIANPNLFGVNYLGNTVLGVLDTPKVVVTGSLEISGSVTGSAFTGSFTGSFAGPLIGTASWAQNIPLQISAGTQVNSNVSSIVFSNANNLTFGLNNSTITVSYQAPLQSYYENIPAIFATNTSNFGTGANLVQPFVLPYDISISYIRVPIQFSYASSTFASTSNAAIFYRQTQTYYANIYSAGAGLSSKSLRQFAQGSVSLIYHVSASQAASSTNQTNAFHFTWYSEGQTTSQDTYSITTPQSAAFNFTTNVLSSVTGLRMIDIPFATSLPAGEYWIALQRSSAFGSTGLAAMSNLSLNNQFGFATQANISGFGVNSTNSTIFQMQPGVGSYSATIQGGTTNSIALSEIRTIASQPRTPLQFIRFA
jgi:hypothetical protein